jgi:protocatechuate 3,4-dioxygenase beta subunit
MSAPASLDRRRFLARSVALASTFQLQRAAFALGFAPSTEVCKLNPEQEVGPFYVRDEAIRSNIAEDKPGFPLTLRVAVLDARTCKPLSNAAIDLWHCDALGLYSGFTAQNGMGGFPGGPGDQHGPPPPDFDPEHAGPPPDGFPGGGPGGENTPTDKLTFLRGVQLTDANGAVLFHTIFPGFYQGRVNHIHFKVRVGGTANEHTYAAGHTSHVGQIFFPEEETVRLMAMEPYVSHKIHRTLPKEDQVFTHQHGDLFVASLRFKDHANPQAGLSAELIAAVDPTASPAVIGPGGFGGPRGPRPYNGVSPE